MRFQLTIDVLDVIDIPARPIAQILREAAAYVETRIPLEEAGEMLGIDGNPKCAWTFAAEAIPK